MYSLAYEMLVQVLRQLKYSGEFHAAVSPRSELRDGGRVILLVRNGSVISCFILNRSGQKLYHDADALRLLPSLGVLDWKLVPSAPNPPTPPSVGQMFTTPPTSRPMSPDRSILPPSMPPTRPMLPSSMPRRLLVPENQTRSWSTLQRSVYSLADGTRTIEQIAMLLSRPLSTIEQVIRDFQASGFISRS